jgi:exosortase
MNGNQTNETHPGWWPDTVDCWRRLPNKAFFFALLAVWLMLFQFLGNSILGFIHTQSLFAWLNGAYNSKASDDAHGKLIPFLVVGLFWWKRKELLALPLQVWWPGLLILMVAMVLHIFGYVIQQPRLSVMGLFLGIYGLMGLAWGRAWLGKSLFPFFLFSFSIPLGVLANFITFPLRLLVTSLAADLSQLLTINVVRQGTQLINPSGGYQYEVAAACSGMRSLVAIFLLATIYGFVMFRSPGKRLLLMSLALPLSVLGNLARLLCIIFAAEIGGQSAGNYIHESSIFSLVPYLPAIGGLLFLGRWLEKWRETDVKKT